MREANELALFMRFRYQGDETQCPIGFAILACISHRVS